MVTKTDQVLLRRLDIARLLVNGADWPEIAAWLRSEGIEVSTGQARVYWWRHCRDTPAAVIVAEAEAAAWAERCAELIQLVDSLQQSLAASEAARNVAEAESADLRLRLRQGNFALPGCQEGAQHLTPPQVTAPSPPPETPPVTAPPNTLQARNIQGGPTQTEGAQCAPKKRLSGFEKKASRFGLVPSTS